MTMEISKDSKSVIGDIASSASAAPERNGSVAVHPTASVGIRKMRWIKPSYTVINVGSEVTSYLYQE
jgi:coenzyme PQQ precursor peptide PqqA